MTRGPVKVEPDWEDIDLLRMVCPQVANYVALHQTATELIANRQFEGYHKLTAFVMHDLKNLIAQQELVVENAAKFLHKPEFVADAIVTIEHSAQKMSRLLMRLQQSTFDQQRDQVPTPISLDEALGLAVQNCQGDPVPALLYETEGLTVSGTLETVSGVFTHLIKNAQLSTAGPDGAVEIIVRSEADCAIIEVRDNGAGMSPEFVRERLFAPFESTREGSGGMGVGAYQCLNFVNSLKGHLKVESAPGAGTTFTVTLPLAGSRATQADV